MQIVFEKEVSTSKQGGSIYILLEDAFHNYLNITKPEQPGVFLNDLKIGMGIGKHGKFLYIYSPPQQKKWKKEQEKEGE